MAAVNQKDIQSVLIKCSERLLTLCSLFIHIEVVKAIIVSNLMHLEVFK